MKLAKGVTVYRGHEKFEGEITDEKARKLGLKPEKKKETSQKKDDRQ
jgi:hypothetical protein